MRETDPRQSPLRRGVGAVFAGVMVTVLASAGFGIYGLVTRVGGDDWRRPGSVVVERETGASFVYLNDVLYPTLNLASAMLAAGQPNPTVHRVASRSLADVARGNPIGIPGAPDSLPPAGRQIGLPWTVCATTETDQAGSPVSSVGLAVGVPANGGAPLGEAALLVTDADGRRTYLIWHGHRYLVRSPGTVLPVLFRAGAQTEVGTAWLNAIPAGLDIEAVTVSRPGQPSRGVPGFDNGDVLVLSTLSGPDHYLVLDDGLLLLTDLQVAVLGADDPVEPIEVTPSEIERPLREATPAQPTDADPPATAPQVLTPDLDEPVCATTAAGSTTPTVTTGAAVDGLARATRTTGVSADGLPLANRVLVPPGTVSVIRAVATSGAPTGTYAVVTDVGIAYPVPDPSVLVLLGYSPAQAVDIPADLALLIPAGPALDPAAVVPDSPLT
jgi:type VII secretion protein EccB